jgi:3-phenylpropionate/cinnamic acid dioxygenase small subunit
MRLHSLLAPIVPIVLITLAAPLAAQRPDSARASFSGRIVNRIDSTAVPMADVRVYRVDSARTLKDHRGKDSLDIFVDTARSRVAATDSTGAFVIRRMEEGSYILNVRRIGFAQLEGIVRVDSGAVRAELAMEPTSRLLSKVTITEASSKRLEQKLDRVGFVARSHSGESGTFITRQEVMRRKAQTIGDVLQWYGIHSGQIVLDHMPLEFDDIREYPADLLAGIEIYRHGRPTEFNMTRRGRGALSSGTRLGPALVVIWTYIP